MNIRKGIKKKMNGFPEELHPQRRPQIPAAHIGGCEQKEGHFLLGGCILDQIRSELQAQAIALVELIEKVKALEEKQAENKLWVPPGLH